MNNLKCLLGLFLVVCLWGRLAALPLTPEDMSRLQKYRFEASVGYEAYLQTQDTASAGVMGFQFDTFFQPHTAGVLAIYGAVSGSRGGYGIAMVGLAQQWQISPQWRFDFRGLVGSGGGGGLAAGGGFGVEALTGLIYEMTPSFATKLYTGYLSFPSGHFSSWVVGLDFSYAYSALFLPY